MNSPRVSSSARFSLPTVSKKTFLSSARASPSLAPLSFFFVFTLRSSRNSVSQLNNFTRIERTLHLLEIPFNTNHARQIMTMEKGAVQQLLYQLYTALNRKKKRNLTGTAMETMTAPATKILAQAETQQYQNVRFNSPPDPHLSSSS